MVEDWRVVIEAPWYSVSNLGRVKNRRVDKVLKLTTIHSGHQVVSLGGQVRPVHHIVMEAFSDEDVRGKRVRHIDGDKTNNRPGNLELVHVQPTPYRQGNRGKLKQGVRIVDTGEEFESMMAVAKRLDTTVGYISNVLRNRKAPGIGKCKGHTIELIS